MQNNWQGAVGAARQYNSTAGNYRWQFVRTTFQQNDVSDERYFKRISLSHILGGGEVDGGNDSVSVIY